MPEEVIGREEGRRVFGSVLNLLDGASSGRLGSNWYGSTNPANEE